MPVNPPHLLTPGEVAAMFHVNRETVSRWRRAGMITAVRTPGGIHRYDRAEIEALLRGDQR